MTIKKDGNYYTFKSKFKNLNHLYNITPELKEQVNVRLKRSIDFMSRADIEIDGNRLGSLLDVSWSANIRPSQYHGEIVERVSSLQKYAKEYGFDTPVFITLTPPSEYKPLKQIKIKSSNNKFLLVDNPNFNGDPDFVRSARDYITNKWRKFLNQRLFKEIRQKYKDKLIYMRTYEPFLDGTPHVHLMVFIPAEYKDRFVNLVKNYFKDTKTDVKTQFYGDPKAVVAYILKYILKSFYNSKIDKLDDVGYWYAAFSIRRFTSSRTLMSLGIYRKIKHDSDYRDLMHNTQLFKWGTFTIKYSYRPLKFWDKIYKNDLNFKMSDMVVGEITVLEGDMETAGYVLLYNRSEKIDIIMHEKATKIRLALNDPAQPFQPIAVYENDSPTPSYFLSENFKRINQTIPISQTSTSALYREYFMFDDDKGNLHRYGIIKNELIKRGFFSCEILSLNEYDTSFDCDKYKKIEV